MTKISGTKEWAAANVNCLTACSNRCPTATAKQWPAVLVGLPRKPNGQSPTEAG